MQMVTILTRKDLLEQGFRSGLHDGNGYSAANPQSTAQLVTKICAIADQI